MDLTVGDVYQLAYAANKIDQAVFIRNFIDKERHTICYTFACAVPSVHSTQFANRWSSHAKVHQVHSEGYIHIYELTIPYDDFRDNKNYDIKMWDGKSEVQNS